MGLNLPEQRHKLDWEKYKGLVHYICAKAPNPKKLGATKLNKILFYSDREAYLTLGQPITGEVYTKQKFGPVSKHILSAIEELEREGALAVSEASGYFVGQRHPQRLFFSRRNPSLSRFSAEEISLVDEVLHIICNKHTAQSISDLSHDLVREAAEIGEEIPYFTAMSTLLGEINAEDIAWAKGEIERRLD